MRCWFIEHLGYKEGSINKLYEHLTLITAGLATLAFQYFRVKIRSQQTEEQARQTDNQIAQTRNLTKTQQDDQFKKAIELLSNSDSTFTARANGVYLLGVLGCETKTHAQSCLNMLAELNRWMGQRLKTQPDYFDREKGWHSRVVIDDEQSLIEPKKAEAKLDNPQQTKDLSKEQQQQAKESLEAEDLSRLALIKIADIIKAHAHDDGTPNKNLSKFNLQGKFLCQLDLHGLHLDDRIDFSNTRLQGAFLYNTHLQGANLQNAQMRGADLQNAKMQGAYLPFAQMQGAYLFCVQMQGANLQDAKMQKTFSYNADIRGADLRNAQMQGAYLEFAQMQGTSLYNADMQGANLRNAQVQGANLRNAQMQGADLEFAQMQGANLRNAQMQGADFNDTNMQGISIAREHITFKERISSRRHQELNSDQTGVLTDEGIKTIIDNLEKRESFSPGIIDDIKKTLQSRANTAPNLDGIIYGQLTQEECDTIINDYNRAMESVPKRNHFLLDNWL